MGIFGHTVYGTVVPINGAKPSVSVRQCLPVQYNLTIGISMARGCIARQLISRRWAANYSTSTANRTVILLIAAGL